MANKSIPGIGTANDYRVNSGRFAYGKESGLEVPKGTEKFLPKDTVTKTPRSADWRAAQKKTFAADTAKRTAEIVKNAGKSSVASRAAGAVARGALRVAGPVGALVGMTTPVGVGSDKPSGPLMKGNAEQMRGARVGPTQAPNRTAQSTASPPKGRSSYGGGGRDSGRSSYEGSGARSSGVASRPTSSGKSSYGGGARDSRGVSKSAPARGTERFAKGSLVKSKVNQAGTYTKPGMRKKMFESIKASAVQGTKAGQWSARKAQLLAKKYKASGGGYK